MEMTTFQKALQIADDLDEQASDLNRFISNPVYGEADRVRASSSQSKLREYAAAARIFAIEIIVDDVQITVDSVVAAADKAKSVAKNIGKFKSALDLAAATILFFGSISTGNPVLILGSWDDFLGAIENAEIVN